MRFINSVITSFQEKLEGTDDYIILPGFFDIPKKVVSNGYNILSKK